MLGKWISRVRQMIRDWRDFPLREGTVVGGRYRLGRFLGMGSYGQAYAGIDRDSGEPVLVKLNKPSKGTISRLLLKRESDLMQSLSHPQIPRWIDYFDRGNRSALIMELVDGFNLETLIMERGRVFDERETAAVIRQLMNPIIHVHERGFVHRDVRIPNVIAGGGGIHLIDFGLACRIGEKLPERLRSALGEGSAEEPGRSWGGVKRRMRHPEPVSDLYGTGHFALFMLYSGYTPREGEEPGSWETELSLSAPMRQWIRRSLGEDEPFADAVESAAMLDKILQEKDGRL